VTTLSTQNIRHESMRVLALFIALEVAASLAVRFVFRADLDRVAGFNFGLALFTANVLLLTFLTQRLFAAAGGEPSSEGKRPTTFLALLFAMKLVLLLGGAYIGLVVFGVPVLWFTIGLVAGLAAVTIASLGRSHRR
jgi:hypothetical protein